MDSLVALSNTHPFSFFPDPAGGFFVCPSTDAFVSHLSPQNHIRDSDSKIEDLREFLVDDRDRKILFSLPIAVCSAQVACFLSPAVSLTFVFYPVDCSCLAH